MLGNKRYYEIKIPTKYLTHKKNKDVDKVDNDMIRSNRTDMRMRLLPTVYDVITNVTPFLHFYYSLFNSIM